MDFSGVREQIAEKFTGESSSDQPDASKESQETGTQESAPQNENQTHEGRSEQAAQALIDLSKAEKFLFDGKEYTLEQLNKERMLQADYTRKTQAFAEERKTFERQQDLERHFQADFPKVLQNPKLLSELSKHYPPEMVERAREIIGSMQQTAQPQESGQSGTVTKEEIKELIQSEVGSYKQEVESQRLVSELDSVFAEMKSKFPEMKESMMERFVLSELQAKDGMGHKITRDVVESTFRQLNDWMVNSRSQYHKEQLKKQSEANNKAKDVGAGGGTPGQAPRRLKLGDVKGALTDHLKQQFGR